MLDAFALTAFYPSASRFVLEGLEDTRADLERRAVPLVMPVGSAADVIPAITREAQAAPVAGDENPVRVGCAVGGKAPLPS